LIGVLLVILSKVEGSLTISSLVFLFPIAFLTADPGFSMLDARFRRRDDKRADERVEQWLSPLIQMKRELKPEEHEEIVIAVTAGDRVKATSLYLPATGGDLTTAQNFIKTSLLKSRKPKHSRQQKSVPDAKEF
jgi:hypothetical protein